MRTRFALVVLLAAFAVAGCDDVIGPDVDLVIENPYDLRVQAWDSYDNGPQDNVTVTVVQTGDASVTGGEGWTDYLETPYQAGNVSIVVEWFDLHGAIHSFRRSVALRHGTTEVRVTVDTRPYH